MYLDPGFGGMLLQVIVVIAAVGGGILFSLRKKIKNLFSKKDNKKAPISKQVQIDIEDDALDILED